VGGSEEILVGINVVGTELDDETVEGKVGENVDVGSLVPSANVGNAVGLKVGFDGRGVGSYVGLVGCDVVGNSVKSPVGK
jgi:hypothetical protein